MSRSIALSLTAALVGTDALALTSGPARGVVSSPRGAVSMVESWYDSGKRLAEDTLGAGGGHAVGKAGMEAPKLTAEEMKIQKNVMEHQRGAARLSQAEDARSLVAYSTGYATLATNSAALEGYPSAALVGYALDAAGLPVFCFSAMSTHTKDLVAAERTCTEGGKAALCVTANGFKGAADGRVTLIGDVKRVSAEQAEADGLPALYRSKHPNAFWADFGDFSYFRMHNLKAVNYVGGFARAGSISPEEYMGAMVDPIQAFAAPVMAHMNGDHGGSTIAMVHHYLGLPGVEKAELVQMDRLGLVVQCTRKEQSIDGPTDKDQVFKVRLPFPRAAEDRKDVKTLIVEMTRTSLANPVVQEAMQTVVDEDARKEKAKAAA